jgi:hypothetical protein
VKRCGHTPAFAVSTVTCSAHRGKRGMPAASEYASLSGSEG